MSLIQRIPPLISALAFGYGVGMAAPESTVTSMNAAVSAYQEGGRSGRPPGQVLMNPPPRINSTGLGGSESRELMRLREAASRDLAREGHALTDLERPSFSKAPRYESRMDRDISGAEADDLDGAGTEALSRLQLPDMRVSVTRRTLKYVRFFTRTDRGRGMFETWLKRSGKFSEMIQTELRERRLPEDLMWVAMIESGFDARVKSPAGAVGLWQFMPSTGGVYGLTQSRWVDQRKNPKLATQAAAHHLRDLYLRFGSWDLALAAYNMGYEQLLDAIDKYGTADFNELARQEAIPSETSAYVPKIAAAAIVANNLEHFGFDKVDIQRPVDAAELPVPPGAQLKLIAKAAGISTQNLRSLNPDLLGERMPPGHGDFLLLVPADTVSRARAALPSMLANEPVGVDEASALDPVDLLQGRELTKRRARTEDDSLLALLPHYKKHGSLRSPMDGDDDDGDHERPYIERDADGPRLFGSRSKKRKETVVYKVAAGDTIASVAKQFGVEPEEVAKKNHLAEDDKLKAGAMLKLQVRRDVLDDTADKDKPSDSPHGKHHKKGHHDES